MEITDRKIMKSENKDSIRNSMAASLSGTSEEPEVVRICKDTLRGNDSIKINKMLTPYNHTKGNISRIQYIVIHYVGALGGARQNCSYFAETDRKASAHYFVGFDGEIWQSVEDKDIAWHCGAKSYKHPKCRNSNSIGIELCVRKKNPKKLGDDDKDWYFEDATVESAARLTRSLMKKYHIAEDHIVRHYDVTGKICPNPFVYNTTKHTWKEFKKKLKRD